MRRVSGNKLETIKPFFEAAAQEAENATCRRAKCGAVIVKNNLIIGRGFNSPAGDDESQRVCDQSWDYSIKPKYDLTCCVHAEWRAVIDACKNNEQYIGGSILYFMRIDHEGNFTDAGVPFCTVCSRITMDAGVGEFALWNNDGADIYPLDEYNAESYAFYKPKP
jgi:deoxycytidylate deaminase